MNSSDVTLAATRTCRMPIARSFFYIGAESMRRYRLNLPQSHHPPITTLVLMNINEQWAERFSSSLALRNLPKPWVRFPQLEQWVGVIRR